MVASFFLLREAEASVILNRSSTLITARRWSDYSCRRRRRIPGPALSTDPGVVYAAGQKSTRARSMRACDNVNSWTKLSLVTCNGGAAADDMASFPDLAGEVCSTAAVVEAVEQLATALGLPLIGPDGRRAFGGHVCRVSGAIHLADVGVEIRAMMLLARWEGEVVMRYARDSPLRNLIGKYLQRTSAVNVIPSSSETPAIADMTTIACCEVATPNSDVAFKALKLNAKVAECEAMDLELLVSDLSHSVDALQRDNAPGYIVSDGGSGPIHVVANNYRICHLDVWVTRCGWRYECSRHGRLTTIPGELFGHRLCERCLPEARTSRIALQALAPPHLGDADLPPSGDDLFVCWSIFDRTSHRRLSCQTKLDRLGGGGQLVSWC